MITSYHERHLFKSRIKKNEKVLSKLIQIWPLPCSAKKTLRKQFHQKYRKRPESSDNNLLLKKYNNVPNVFVCKSIYFGTLFLTFF